MVRRVAWLIVPLVVAVVLLVMRHRSEPSEPTTSAPSAATTTGGAGVAGAARPGEPGRSERGSPAARTSQAPSSGSSPTIAETSGRAGAVRPGGPGPASPSAPASGGPGGSAGSGDDDSPDGKLTDRTGWNDPSLGKQLNKEFMPLASECIDQAKARKPGLRGMLAYSMVLAPGEGGKAMVASVRATANNEIQDPELFECIRESSFSLDGLKAPHDFDITMPIE